ncbi:regulator [Pseudomonas syringae]|uniref:regulator n=1 Tax=Pseudomonas syringae TaxID=317 RepID=UPI001F1F5BD3|nr:regulator [Pseudomonas syringae]GKQ49111.1 regulator [Pseudomonas syringae pv. theae]
MTDLNITSSTLPHDSHCSTTELSERVDRLYSDACRRYSTYETVVLHHFCSLMIDTFGDDEKASGAAEAFAYDRANFDYLTPLEIAAATAADKLKGFCSHGLTVMNCPCGCFELDETDDDQDFGFEFEGIEDDSELIAEEWAQKVEQWRQDEATNTSRTTLKAAYIYTKTALNNSLLKFVHMWR